MVSGDNGIGACYGFSVRSSLPFRYLRRGEGSPLTVSAAPAVVEERDRGDVLLRWSPTSRFPLPGRLHHNSDGFHLWIESWGWFAIDPDSAHVTVPDAPDVVRREERLWSIPAMLCFMARGDTPVHAAAVEVDGEAIVIAAPGTFGKTTLAAAFHLAGHRLLSEDNTCLRGRQEPSVVPGPAMLRLRPDMADRLHIPRATKVAQSPDRLHLAIDESARGDCAPLPLRAIVLLDGEAGDFELTPASPQDAVRDLFALSFRLPADESRIRCFKAMADVTRAVPVWRFRRPITVDALPDAVEHLIAHA